MSEQPHPPNGTEPHELTALREERLLAMLTANQSTREGAPEADEQLRILDAQWRPLVPVKLDVESKVLTAQQFVDFYNEPETFLDRHGILAAGGLTTLSGPAGSGKSFAALTLALELSADRRNVLWICAEAPTSFAERLKWHGIRTGAMPANLHILADFPRPFRPSQIPPGYNVVIIDTLRSAYPGMKENDSDGMVEALQPLEDWCSSERERSTLVLTHTGWTREGDIPEHGRGSSEQNARVQMAYIMHSDGAPAQGARIICKKNRDGERAPLHGILDVHGDEPGNASWRFTTEQKRGEESDELLNRLTELLDARSLTVNEAKALVSKRHNTVKRALDKLVIDGLAEATKEGSTTRYSKCSRVPGIGAEQRNSNGAASDSDVYDGDIPPGYE